MAKRNTSTGRVLEEMVLPALKRGGYEALTQVHVGTRLGGRRHFVDAIAKKADEAILVSLKWQQTSGTAEQKVPFEVMCLTDLLLDPSNGFHSAYLVLGGDMWSLRDFYTSGGLDPFLAYPGAVRILPLESFIGRANRGEL